MNYPVGTTVKLKVPCLGNPAGTRGVAFYDYGSGTQFIFENGGYDGFSSEESGRPIGIEQDFFLERTGFNEELAGYQFFNVIQVSQDFRAGMFDSALKGV